MNASSSKSPAVSVVIPLYNKRNTLARALASAVAQTFADLEVLVIDDGSTDDGADVARHFGDPRISVRRQDNAGPGAARNLGLAHARGRFITFLDADDEWEPQFLETAVTCLEREPRCGAFAAGYRIRERGRVHRGSPSVREGVSHLTARTRRGEAARCLAIFHACATVYLTEAVRACGGFFARDRCTYGEDVWLWIQIRMRERIYRHPALLGWYHMDDSELGIGGRRSALPLEPAFLHAADLRRRCPRALRPVLAKWLGRHALRAGFLHERDGRADLSRWLLGHVPETRLWPGERLRLRAKLTFPGLWAALVRTRHAIRSPLTRPRLRGLNPTTP